MYGSLAQVCLCSWDSNMQDIPASDSFSHPQRTGHLSKLTGRGWLYSGAWKDRYCVLDGSKFYFYENEESKGVEKSCGVINLDYYDACEENKIKDKKAPHVFVLGTSVRGFFDNRHQFAASTAEEMQGWIEAIRTAVTEARVARRKPGRKRQQPEGKSPDLSSSSQESEGTSTACLVNATKDRARGPQGRRLPQRKSMMPTTRSAEDNDLRQRSISLSSPQSKEESSPRLQSHSDSRLLSISMEEIEREKEDPIGKRSSSTFDIPQQEVPSQMENGEVPKPAFRKHGPRLGNLMGQHAALTKELEMKLKAGMTPGHRRLPSENEDDEQNKDEVEAGRKIDCLAARVDLTKDTLNVLEERVSLLTSRVEATSEKSEKAKSEVGDVLLQVTVTLKEAERINGECKRALEEASKARTEYQLLVKECKNTLSKLNAETDLQENET